MRTDDGWSVEQITLDARCWLVVKYLGALRGGDPARSRPTGLHASPAAVRATMGEAFTRLRPA